MWRTTTEENAQINEGMKNREMHEEYKNDTEGSLAVKMSFMTKAFLAIKPCIWA